MTRAANLKLPISSSPVTKRALLSKLRDDDGLSSVGDDDVTDMSMDEDLLLGIRMLVKKEKYLKQLEDQLRDEGDDSGDRQTIMCQELYDEEDEEPRRKEILTKQNSHQRNEPQEETRKVKSLLTGRISKLLSLATEHYRACFVDINPIQLRDIRELVLVSQDLQIHQLRSLSKNLFLFSALRSVNLSNNQLDDSGCKEIRDLMCCPGLRALDLSRNLLGRLTARTICERLRHQAKLLSLNLHGNLFFSDGGETARETARLFATAIAGNESLLHFCLSVPDQLEKIVSLGNQWKDATSRRNPNQVNNKGKDVEIMSAAAEFSQHLAGQLRQGNNRSSLQSIELCYAEFSRRVVLNTVKMVNRLTTLDLSFAFIGIPGAQVVAAAFKIEGYVTLTQLNLNCNRVKSMGAKMILSALRRNERLTFLDLSHNEIRHDALDAVVELLNDNKVLSRLDLSQNKLIGGETEEVQYLREAIVKHRALLSLGQLNSLVANEENERELQRALDRNHIAEDREILDSINVVCASRLTAEAAPSRQRNLLNTVVELGGGAQSTTVWKRKITRNGRLSLKWRMAVRTKISVTESKTSSLVWKLVVNRKCDVRDSVEDDAAIQTLPDKPGSSYALYSAVAYCDKGDTVSLTIGVHYDDVTNNKVLYKVCVKDIAFIPHHPQDRRHLLFFLSPSLSGTPVQWQMKTQRRMISSSKNRETDSASFLWEGIIQRVYIHTTGSFRLLARVQFSFSDKLAGTNEKKFFMLETLYWWQLQRSSCWDPQTNDVVMEGTYLDMYGVIRDDCEVVFYLPSMEWMVGEYLQFSSTSANEDVGLRVVDFQLFHEVVHWENYVDHV